MARRLFDDERRLRQALNRFGTSCLATVALSGTKTIRPAKRLASSQRLWVETLGFCDSKPLLIRMMSSSASHWDKTREQDTTALPTAHFDRNNRPAISGIDANTPVEKALLWNT